MTDRVRRLERLGRYLWEAGDPHAAVDASEEALTLLPDGPPSPLRARVLAALATHRMLLGEFAEALPAAERAVAEARQADAVAEQAHGLATLGILLAQRGDLDAGMAALRTSFTLAREAGNIEDVVRAATNHMYLLCTAGRFTEALEVARAGRQAARSLGAPPLADLGPGQQHCRGPHLRPGGGRKPTSCWPNWSASPPRRPQVPGAHAAGTRRRPGRRSPGGRLAAQRWTRRRRSPGSTARCTRALPSRR